MKRYVRIPSTPEDHFIGLQISQRRMVLIWSAGAILSNSIGLTLTCTSPAIPSGHCLPQPQARMRAGTQTDLQNVDCSIFSTYTECKIIVRYHLEGEYN
jgi:hypothetical protein